MKLRLLLSLSLLAAWQSACAQSADDFFHGGAQSYLSNNIPAALERVTNGLALYPGDIKLKKLEELLKQQQQQNQQQQNQQSKQDQKQDQQKQDSAKQDQQKDQQSKDQAKQDQQQKQDKQQAGKGAQDQKNQQKQDQQQARAAGQMTPQEAQQLLDAQKGDEQLLQFGPEGKPKNRERAFKDW